MTEKPVSNHTTLTVEESSDHPAIIIPTNISNGPTTTSRLRCNRRSVPALLSSSIRLPSSSHPLSLSSLIQRSMTNRQRAEIQLDVLVNEPEESLPTFVRRASSQMGDEDIPLKEVAKLLNTQPFVIERLVHALYASSGSTQDTLKALNKTEIRTLTRILNSTIDVRALLFFMMLDENGNDFITRQGFIDFYQKYLTELKTFDEERLQEVIKVLLQKFHLDQKIRIDYEEFYSIVSKDSTLLETLSQFTVHPTWFMDSPKPSASSSIRLRCFRCRCCDFSQHKSKLTSDYARDNVSRIVVFLLYLLVNLGLMIYVIVYRVFMERAHVLIVIARVSGMLLNFNCSLTIVLMLKQTILIIRTIKCLRTVIPVDDHIDFHKFVGKVIAALSIIHSIAHITNFSRYEDHSWTTYMFTTKSGIGWIDGFASISGLILLTILAIMVIFSMQWIRRGGHFQIFYWTHLLYLPFFIFLILHAKNFWKWVVGPLSLFLLEKIYSILTRYSAVGGRTYLQSATIEQSNVISLKIHRPKYFNFRPGDYISINLPRVALYEFHPFTISSAPEDSEFLTVHIQAVGNWTRSVYRRFKTMSETDIERCYVKVYRADLQGDAKKQRMPSISQAEADDDETISSKLKRREPVFISGPYSSCARYVFDCKHVVLIGGGIGITPYASILSSLMAQFRASRTVCSHCQGINYNAKSLLANRRLRKVDFIWVNRDQKNFEWFLNLLRQFEQEQDDYLASNVDEKRFLDIHLYFTEIKHDQNIGNVPLDLISKVWAQVAGQDIFTSLKSKTHIGRPKWDEVFGRLVSDDNASTANDVDVFFCGPRAMSQTIRNYCATYRFRYYEEKF